jgi:NAD(P)-dependent dehydrogenase (short-subunit alcohol dehydrogenase family)
MTKSILILKISALLLIGLVSPAYAASDASPAQSAVLVTGASTGIGRNIAERLAREGYFVYAGARNQTDIDALSAIENIRGVRLDVTIESDIKAAVEIIEREGKGLFGIVNNAGVVVMGILAETEESELDYVFDVNVYGPYRIVKAFTPMIVQSKGRIVNISSMAGIRSSMAYGVYGMSKHAIEAFSDSLELELSTVGVHSSVVEPGPYNSKATATNCKRRMAQGYDPEESLLHELAQELAQLCSGNSTPDFPEADQVSDSVLDALTSERPKQRYLAVNHQLQAEAMVRDIFKTLIQINNNGHSFGYSRDELVNMLDESLATANKHQ